MPSECRFFQVSNVFDSERKKQTKNPPIAKQKSLNFRSQKKNKEYCGKKCPSIAVKQEDSSALGLPTSLTA